MTDDGLAELAHICGEMVKQLGETHPHRDDYDELRVRLEGEQRQRAEILRQRNLAATILQSAIRGKLARDEAERLEQARILEQQTKAATILQSAIRGKLARDEAARLEEARVLEQRTRAALAIQAMFRGNQARDEFAELQAKAAAAEALRLEQERRMQAQLVKADERLGQAKVDPARVKQNEKLELGRLLETYDAARLEAPNRKVARAKLQALSKAESELKGYVNLLIAAVNSQLAKEKKVADAARSVVTPPEFKPNGAPRDCGTVLYPAAGTLRIGTKDYQFHPNRAMIHVRDELADNADLATAQAYFNSCLAACRTAIGKGTGEYALAALSLTGANVTWNIKYKTAKGEYAGEIYHIDSGYAFSGWLPGAKRGKCRTCNKPKNRHDNSHPIT